MSHRQSLHRAARPARHGRHGRLGRSSVVRPPLRSFDGRMDRFDLAVGATIEFLRGAWPELRDADVLIGGLPMTFGDGHIPRWTADRHARRIVIYRMPVERLDRMLSMDALHQRILVESIVFRAAADYLDRDPWDLGPDNIDLL